MPRFQHAGDGGETLGNLARHAGGLASRVERLRVEPDFPQALADRGIAELVERDAEPTPIGELRVIFPLTGEIGVGFDDVADIAHQDERRPAVIDRQGAGIVGRLPMGVEHEHIEAGGGDAAGFGAGGARGDGFDLFVAALLSCLLGFQHEATPLVEIDPAGRDRAIRAGFLHRALEHVIIIGGGRGGGIGARHVEHVT